MPPPGDPERTIASSESPRLFAAPESAPRSAFRPHRLLLLLLLLVTRRPLGDAMDASGEEERSCFPACVSPPRARCEYDDSAVAANARPPLAASFQCAARRCRTREASYCTPLPVDAAVVRMSGDADAAFKSAVSSERGGAVLCGAGSELESK